MNPKVSIIITTYHSEIKNLKRAINSVLNQSYKNIEIIVVDDNEPYSKERKKTKQLLENLKKIHDIIYLQHEKNMNGAVARNTGIKKAQGDYVGFLDDDDFYFPQKIEKNVAILEKNKHYCGVYNSVLLVSDKKIRRLIRATKSGDLTYDLLCDFMIIGTGSNLFISKNALKELNGFDEAFLRFQDIEFLMRFFEKFKLFNQDEVLVVKDTNKRSYPNFIMLKEMTDLFAMKYKNTISNLPLKKQNDFYYNVNNILIKAGKMCTNKKEINEVNMLLKKENQKKLDICKLNFNRISKKMRKLSLIRKVNSIRYIRKSHKLYRNLENEKKLFLKKQLKFY